MQTNSRLRLNLLLFLPAMTHLLMLQCVRSHYVGEQNMFRNDFLIRLFVNLCKRDFPIFVLFKLQMRLNGTLTCVRTVIMWDWIMENIQINNWCSDDMSRLTGRHSFIEKGKNNVFAVVKYRHMWDFKNKNSFLWRQRNYLKVIKFSKHFIWCITHLNVIARILEALLEFLL